MSMTIDGGGEGGKGGERPPRAKKSDPPSTPKGTPPPQVSKGDTHTLELANISKIMGQILHGFQERKSTSNFFFWFSLTQNS